MTSAVVVSCVKSTKSVKVTIKAGGKEIEQSFERVIMAAGIVANTENMGLDNTNIKLTHGHIVTNQWLETDEKGVYAIGDVTSGPWLAHKASHEAVICVEKIAGKHPHALNKNNIPGCTYARPQIASVGLTEAKALEAGYKIKIGRFPLLANGKALAIGEPTGLIKTIFDEKTGELLGAHMIGAEVTEMIQGYVIAKGMEGTELDLMQTIFPHPTLSEAMHESTLAAYGRAIHI
jgi:dihydrolipoamide dehydrogenase